MALRRATRFFCLPLLLTACSTPGGEADGIYAGTLKLRIGNFDGESRSFYHLELVNGDVLPLELLEPTRLGPNTPVRVQGVMEGDSLLVESIEVDLTRPMERVQPSPDRDPRTLKLLAASVNSSLSQAQTQKRVFQDPDSPHGFYGDNSYGSWTMEGIATGPLSTVSTSGCKIDQIKNDANKAMKDSGIDWETYDNIMYFVPSSAGCSWGGIAEVGTNPKRGFRNGHDSWYAGTGCVVLNQELGHNYGMLHSHTCSGPPYTAKSYGGNDCPSYQEYGDKYTPMGGGCGHFNPVEAGCLTYLANCNTLKVTGSGTFEIGPVEDYCTGPQILRYPLGMANQGEQFLYVSYRKGKGTIGSDTFSSKGLYIHAGPLYEGNPTNSTNPDYAVNMDPFNIKGAPIAVGGSWTEPQSKVEIKLTSADATAKVELVIPGGNTMPPTCLDGAMPPPGPQCGTGGTGGTGGMGGTGGTGGMGGTGGTAGMGGTGGMGGSAGTAGTGGTAGMGGTSGTGGTSGSGGTAGTGGAGGSAGVGGGGMGGTGAVGGVGGTAGVGGGGSGGSAGVGGGGDAGTAGVGGDTGGTGGSAGTGATAGVGGAAGSGTGAVGGTGTGTNPSTDPEGCACRVQDPARAPWYGAASWIALGLLGRRRWRRRAPS